MNLLAAGAGANEGLDQMLTRMLAERQVGQRDTAQAEEARHNQAGEQISREQLASLTGERDALAAERAQMTKDRQAAAEAEVRRQQEEEALLKDPNTPDVVKHFIQARRVTPKGENVPYQLFAPPSTGNVNQQKASYTTSDPEVAKAMGVKPGDPFTVWQSPRADAQGKREIRSMSGADLSAYADRLKPYEAPFLVPVQSGEQYFSIDRRNPNAPARPIKDNEGNDLALATTGSTRTMQEGAIMLAPHVAEVDAMAQELDKRGLFGPILSRVRQVAAKYGSALDSDDPDQQAKAMEQLGNEIKNDPNLNTDRLVGKFASMLGFLTSGAGRVHGQARGGGSISMINYMKSLLSDSASLPMFQGRLDALGSILKGYAEGPKPRGGEKTKESPGVDLYQEYVNSTKLKK